MNKVALTGTICSGKSFVLNILKKLGYPTFSSDQAVNDILLQDNDFIGFLQKKAPETYTNLSKINKKLLAKKIFEDVQFGLEYEQEIYPKIDKLRRVFVEENKECKLLFFEVPLLFEKKLYNKFDKIILVDAKDSDLEKRLFEKEKKLGKDIVEKILAKQIPNKEKLPKSDYIINTSLPESDITEQLIKTIKRL